MAEVKKQIVEHPNKDDLHEQRDPNQPREGVVQKPRPPAQSEVDQQRADREGMPPAPSQPDPV